MSALSVQLQSANGIDMDRGGFVILCGKTRVQVAVRKPLATMALYVEGDPAPHRRWANVNAETIGDACALAQALDRKLSAPAVQP